MNTVEPIRQEKRIRTMKADFQYSSFLRLW